MDLIEDQLSFVSVYAPNKCGNFNSVLDSTLDRMHHSSYTGSASAANQESGAALQALLSYTQTYPVWRTPGRTRLASLHHA